MKDGFAWTLGLVFVLYGLYALIAGGAKSEIAGICQDYGQVKIDGKWYECRLKTHS